MQERACVSAEGHKGWREVAEGAQLERQVRTWRKLTAFAMTPKAAERRPMVGTSVDMGPLGLEPLPALVTTGAKEQRRGQTFKLSGNRTN